MKPKRKTELKNYIRKIKRRFEKLEVIPYSKVSMYELEEMKELREELKRIGLGEWHR